MKKIRFALSLALLLVLLVSGTALAADPEPNAPDTINTVTFNPSSGLSGSTTTLSITFTALYNDYNALCIYFPSGTDWSFPTSRNSSQGDPYVIELTTCPDIANFDYVRYSTASAGFLSQYGDVLNLALTVPEIPADTVTFAVRQYLGTPPVEQNLIVAFFDVTAPPASNIYYVASTIGACGSYTPCTTSLATALDAVNIGGTIWIIDNISVPSDGVTFGKTLTVNALTRGSSSITGGGGSAVLNINAPSSTVTIKDMVINAGGATSLIELNDGTLNLKGNTLNGGTNSLNQSGGNLNAYANNFNGFTNAYSGSAGTENLRQNWWGSSSTRPSTITDPEWAARLGSPVVSWADGSPSASLSGASISGGTGTAIIVSHGRSAPPFGNGISEFSGSMCGEYLDFFVRNATGNWTVSLPVDNSSACNTNVRDTGLVFRINDITECAPAENTQCWDRITSGIAINGQNINVNNLSTSSLGGTQFVVGSSTGTDPTVIELDSISATSTRNTWLPLALLAIAISLGGLGLYAVRKQRI